MNVSNHAAAYRHALAATVLGLACAPALAQNVLFLSTAETNGGNLAAVNNAKNAFNAEWTSRNPAPAANSFVDGAGRLSSATDSLTTDLADAKLVVLVGVVAANATRLQEVTAAMQNRPDLLVVAFIDGCCGGASNFQHFLPGVNTLVPDWGGIAASGLIARYTTAELNTASPYQASFANAGVANVFGAWYGTLANVPPAYALYSAAPRGNPPGPSGTYSMFVPQRASNGGAGACLFLTADASPFENRTAANQIPADGSQYRNLATAFFNAAFDPNGACAQPAAGAPDLDASLSGPATLTVGTPVDYTLTVRNTGTAGSTDGSVTVTLPAGVTVDPASLPAGCTAAPGEQSFTCAALPAIAADDSTTIGFRATASAPIATPVDITATIVSVTGEVTTANNTTLLGITADAAVTVPAQVAPVPTLGTWGLIALGGLLPLLARRRRR
ncbi:MAG: hypothetical protein Q4G71_09830 [Pseudomonadota bacterium]|nr:hypothetical protein [Pseudomonadota bacterium]